MKTCFFPSFSIILIIPFLKQFHLVINGDIITIVGYWSELPCPPPGDLPDPGIEHTSLILPHLAGMFSTTGATCEAHCLNNTTPVFLPGESHGRRSLVGSSPPGHKASDTNE